MIPQYNTVLFADIWNNVDSFKGDVKASPLNKLTDASIEALFYLLYAKYGNSPIANYDENQFKFKVYSLIFQYGPSWEKRIEIQDKLRGLSEDELVNGSKAIYNHAFNPSTDPSTCSAQELLYINDQNTQSHKRGKLEAYQMLWDLLATDVTSEFINRFKVCFKQFVMPEQPTLYVTDDEGEF